MSPDLAISYQPLEIHQSLTGGGTNYSKVEGPIDPSFKTKRQPVGTFQGIKVWGPTDPPGQLGIWGRSKCV